MFIEEYYEQLCTNEFVNLENINKFLSKYASPRLNHGRTENLTSKTKYWEWITMKTPLPRISQDYVSLLLNLVKKIKKLILLLLITQIEIIIKTRKNSFNHIPWHFQKNKKKEGKNRGKEE